MTTPFVNMVDDLLLRIATLEAEKAELRDEVNALRQELRELAESYDSSAVARSALAGIELARRAASDGGKA